MKTPRLCAALPLLAAGLMAVTAMASDVVLPEQVFPQLDSILKKAVQQSPNMLSRALNLEIAENNRISARAGMLPSMGGYVSWNQSRDKVSNLYDDPAASSVVSYTVTKIPYAATLSQPIFHWNALHNSARIGQIQQSIVQGQQREAYRMLAQVLRAEYMRMILLKVLVARAHHYQEMTANQLKQEEERLVKKVISEAEIFGVRINAERAQIAAERAEFDLQNAKTSFARLSGMGAAFTDADIPDGIPATGSAPDSLNQMLAEFLGQKDPVSGEASTYRQLIAVEKLNYEIARTRLWPKMNAAIGFTQDEQSNLYGTGAKYQVTSQYVGVSLNWSIFDGFAAGAAKRNTLARRRLLENDYRVLTERLAQDAQNQIKLVGLSARTMSINDRLLVSGEGNLRATNEEFSRGVRSEAEINQAKLGLYDAQYAAYASRREFLMSIGDFLGTVVEDPVVANLAEK